MLAASESTAISSTVCMGMARKAMEYIACRLCRAVYGSILFVIVDARTKWMDIHYMGNSCTSAITIEKLRDSFATHGLPDTLVSDNGPCFVSQEFEGFMKGSGIRHVWTAPYHPYQHLQ